MYELMIRLYHELDYKKYKIEDLKEMRDILQQFNGETLEVRLKRMGGNNDLGRNQENNKSNHI